MSSAIPRRLLVHSASLRRYDKTVASVKTFFTPAIDLKFVRFEPVKQNAMTSLGEMKNDRFVMVYDCRNSTPVGTTFKFNDEITWGTFVLVVRKVSTGIDDTANPHHLEVSIV